MDIGMPHLDGVQATRAIKATQPDIRIIMFTSNDDQKAFMQALSAGADGYCLKNATEQQLAGAISAVMQGATWLDSGLASKALRTHQTPEAHETLVSRTVAFTKDEEQILRHVANGLNFEQIARDLDKPITILKMELKEILDKLRGCESDPNPRTTYFRLREILDSSKRSYPDSDERPNIRIGEIIGGKYRIEAVIGEGALSMVYRARHTLMDKAVAIKMLHLHHLRDTTQIKRLQNEARAAGSISDPHIVAVHDFGLTEDGQPYLVMDYVAGENLAEKLYREKNIPLKLCLKLLIQVCDALTVLHSKGIIHRDLKLSNIMLVKEKGKYIAKLVDFGIAKTLDTIVGTTDLTLPGEVFGSPAYMSPEQCLGRQVDVRSDLYSMGCILYQLLTGELPFDGDEPLSVMWQQVNELPSRLPFLVRNNTVPVALQTAVFRLLNKDAEKRFQSAERLKLEFEAILSSIEYAPAET